MMYSVVCLSFLHQSRGIFCCRWITEVVFQFFEASTLFLSQSQVAARLQLGSSRYVHDMDRLCKAGFGFEAVFRIFDAPPVQL
jgi:hypothetical protein